jgi:hypothetical protein
MDDVMTFTDNVSFIDNDSVKGTLLSVKVPFTGLQPFLL